MHRRTLVACLSVVASLAACQRAEIDAAAADTHLVQYSTEGNDPAVLMLNGLRVEVAAPLTRAFSVRDTRTPNALRIEIGDAPPLRPAEDPACRFWIWGQSLYVDGAHF